MVNSLNGRTSIEGILKYNVRTREEVTGGWKNCLVVNL